MMYREVRAKIGRAAGVVRTVSLAAAVVACLGIVGSAHAQDWEDYNAITPEQSSQVGTPNYDDETLRVNVWLDRGPDEVYRRGDRMDVRFETNADAYAVVYRIDTEGLVTLLWPRGRLDDGFVFGNHEYRLPVTGGERLRTSSAEGVGYVEAIVSRYPFDLRELELDFHHERDADQLGFYVAGDPYLAMNEVNYAVTGLEDASGYAVTNHVSYYVHRQVDHPRYLCSQCHTDGGQTYDPYRDTCSVEIHHDYGWQNDWYTTYGYYPVYYQPVYVYVDPWSYRPWVNYWYYPWYRWPGVGVNVWFGGCYDWGYSPYYGGDVYTYSGGSRYVPLSKNGGARTKVADRSRGGNGLTKTQRPGDDVITAMKTRNRIDDARGVLRGAGYRDVNQTARPRTEFERAAVERSRPGLQIRGRDPAGGPRHEAMGSSDHAIRIRGSQRSDQRARDDRYGKPTVRTGSRSTDLRRAPNTGTTNRRNIKPVQPRNKGTRVWSGRRQVPSHDRNSTRQVSPGSDARGSRNSTVKPRSSGGQSRGSSPRGSTVRPSTPRSSKPATQSRPPARQSGGGGSRSGGSQSRSAPVRR
jgi:hypothetical protein